ncbi:hypothetical protein MUK71_05505 [Arthrobacter zhangbolii]|uniref:Uncharacterized protein n=1 Tax=Arthrobacter zhangbolii TaxID=2886936 RepID=A0A9X1M8Y4_9MICC|nr:hypothetical protein [Arthrobacter zhangbolii]MCC3273032.1 hypothetical protein [Arthrobacter zhangbolii]UON93082.1 hypothetical protein MUK71_05505 [Arthrobacter zhangbolii]
MQQRPLYIRVRSILTIISTLWLVLAIIGVGFFSGGTTSLALSLILLYGTGAALLVVITAIYRYVSRAARQRVETMPDDNAAAVFVDTTRSATEEIMAALRPAAPAGRPAVSVRMPQTVDALDVAAALAARTAALTSAAAAEKSAAAAAAIVSPAKTKSPVNKSATKKKTGTKRPAQPKKAQAGKSRPATKTATRGAGAAANTTPKKSSGGRKPGSAGKGAGAAGNTPRAERVAAGTGKGKPGTVPPSGPAANTGAAGTAVRKDTGSAPRENISAPAPVMGVPGIRTAEQEILPRLEGAPSCGFTAGPVRTAAVRQPDRELTAA